MSILFHHYKELTECMKEAEHMKKEEDDMSAFNDYYDYNDDDDDDFDNGKGRKNKK